MDVWMYGCMDVWMYGCMDGFMDAFKHKTQNHIQDNSHKIYQKDNMFICINC